VSARALLRVEDLRVELVMPAGDHSVVLEDLTWRIGSGESLGLVGPSGGGKSLAARALLDLLPPGARRSGRIVWRGRDLTAGPVGEWHALRGRGIGLVLQEPQAALDPVMTVGDQVAETLRWCRGLSRTAARRAAHALLAEVQLPDVDRVYRRYPHELSGGMQQRVVIATALAGEPELLVADEPTTALDVTVQRRLLDLLVELQRARRLALLLISHDLGVVADLADRVLVLAAGRLIESAPPAQLVDEPQHPVTRMLVAAYARRHQARPPSTTDPALLARGVTVHYRHQRGRGVGAAAVRDVDVELQSGRVLGLAGESGCGKTSLALALARLGPVRARHLELEGRDLLQATGAELRRLRRRIQLVFQDPVMSLNPRLTVRATIAEAIAAADRARGGPAAAARLDLLLAEAGLESQLLDRYPHELSGGQRQRVAIARALAPAPAVVIADEPTSALDAAERVRLLQRLLAIQERRGLALLLISHDLDLLERFSDRVAVMLEGRFVEIRPLDSGSSFLHPYARELIAAAPRLMDAARPRARRRPAAADGGSARGSAVGCPYFSGCPLRVPSCECESPPLIEVAPGHWLRCPVVVAERG
jgi:peptide/nickel transport system ATP-binding protein